jgi:hypothetical protein
MRGRTSSMYVSIVGFMNLFSKHSSDLDRASASSESLDVSASLSAEASKDQEEEVDVGDRMDIGYLGEEIDGVDR